MWRGKSGDDKSKATRGGSSQSRNSAKGRGSGRSGQQARRAASAEAARSASSGKKIRRIESGSPGERGPVGPRSARAKQPQADPTEIGGPPRQGPPTVSLPPLRQPTGEMAAVDSQLSAVDSRLNAVDSRLNAVDSRLNADAVSASPTPDVGRPPVVDGSTGTSAVRADETVVVSGTSDGVFAARPTDAISDDFQEPPSPDEPFTISDRPTGSSTDRPGSYQAGSPRPGNPLPGNPLPGNPLPGNPLSGKLPGELPGIGAFDLDGRPNLLDVSKDVIGDPTVPADGYGAGSSPSAASSGARKSPGSSPIPVYEADDSPTDPFSEVASDTLADSPIDGGAVPPYDSAYGVARTGPNPAGPVGAAKAAATRGRAELPPPAPGAPRRALGRPTGALAPSGQMHDAEFKSGDKRRKQKPKEPNRMVMALAMALVVLTGAGVAYLLTRDGGEDVASDEAESAELQPEGAVAEQPALTTPEVDAEPAVDEPTLFFDDAQLGPLQQEIAYSIDLVGEPEGSLLQVVVDDIPQGEPGPTLPDLILPGGRHTLHVNMINGDVVAASTPVSVYVLADPPVDGYRANLASIDPVTEGWAEAIRRFDGFRDAGHEGLQLYPISEGYWNIFVEGFGDDRSSVVEYCERFGLAVPDDCFPVEYEAPAASVEAGDSMSEDGDAMNDDGEDGDAMNDDGDAMNDDGDAMTEDDSTTPTTTAGG